MGENPGVMVLGLFIAVVVLGGLFIVLRGGDVATFTDSVAAIAVPVVFIAVALAAVSALKS